MTIVRGTALRRRIDAVIPAKAGIQRLGPRRKAAGFPYFAAQRRAPQGRATVSGPVA